MCSSILIAGWTYGVKDVYHKTQKQLLTQHNKELQLINQQEIKRIRKIYPINSKEGKKKKDKEYLGRRESNIDGRFKPNHINKNNKVINGLYNPIKRHRLSE